ncbi:alpha/beta hydrolase [Nocardiopsis sp. RSe5-2]|uniref:Alpha/beta hydrolase n=1 Tax=Nocardiopsis endophytica TaxID=3018445 RepID=A0ABT4UC54_9ACTN|nr:alpha/beta hydrolase [Nocardiopsis endophytica]MDA2814341.1 alpha/beta hydrolase [Nocardiopsis endophytica]
MTPLRHTADLAETVTTPDGAELRLRTRGPEAAACTVVLAHGLGLSCDTWAPHATRLAAGSGGRLRVVRWDLRGHGGSGRGTARMDMRLLADDLARVVAACAPDGPVVLGGHSLGAMAAARLAADRPGLFGGTVTGVLLAAGSAAGPARAAGRRLAGAAPWAVDRLRRLLPHRLPAYRAAVRRAAFGEGAPEDQVALCAQQLHAAPADVLAEGTAAVAGHDVRGRLEALRRVPVVLLSGGRDRVVPARAGRTLARELPEAEQDVAESAGHMVPAEEPERACAHLARLAGVALEPRPGATDAPGADPALRAHRTRSSPPPERPDQEESPYGPVPGRCGP